MIPISSKPKRFIAALGPARFFVRRTAAGHKQRQAITVLASERLHCRGSPSQVGTLSTAAQAMVNRSTPSNAVAVGKTVAAATSVGATGTKARWPDLNHSEFMSLEGARTKDWWTGKHPSLDLCPGFNASAKQLSSLPLLSFENSKTLTKADLRDYFDNTWALTETLLSALQGEDAFVRPPSHGLRHPMIFYYGHPAAFYVNKLRVAGLLKDAINPYFEVIFETGVDEMSWDDMSKNHLAWPTVAEVHAYRKEVYATVQRVISELTPQQMENISPKSQVWALLMAFEHERIHLETSSFLMSEMPVEYLRVPEYLPQYHPAVQRAIAAGSAVREPVRGVHYPPNELIAVQATQVSIGRPSDSGSFGWDNEYGHRTYDVPAFKASKFKISNGEFLEFVRDGGYSHREYWTETGWQWRAFRNVKWPLHWVRKGPQGFHEFDLRVLFDVVRMPWELPVVVNYHEACAFASWKTAKAAATAAVAADTDGRGDKASTEKVQFRVMTELEHRAIRGERAKEDLVTKFSGNDMPTKGAMNANLGYSSMSPVDAFAPNALGFHDVFGNAWEWTNDYFCALPGFEVHPYYEDFSTPCFDGKHNVIQGGSYMSTGNELSVHSRFHFRPHFYQHASFRVVQVDLSDGDSANAAVMVTSDTDAPGPYVGASYPFRSSSNGVLAASKRNAEDEAARLQNVAFTKHFGVGTSSSISSAVLAATFSLERTASISTPAAVTSAINTSSSAFPLAPLRDMVLEASAKAFSVEQVKTLKLIEVGCGPGGLSMDFAQAFGSVVGIDHDAPMVEIAKKLAVSDTAAAAASVGSFVMQREGDLKLDVPIARAVPHIALRAETEFRCADPMCLPAELQEFDVVVLNDVLDQLSSPNALLGRLAGVRGLVRPQGGLLCLWSAFDWREERTPRSLWLGGYVDPDSGREVQSEQELVSRLTEEEGSEFVLLEKRDVPVLWSTSAREVNGKVYTAMVFQRL